MKRNPILILVAVFYLPVFAVTTPAAKYRPESLGELVSNVRTLARAGARPVVVFDLDDTLFSARSRTHRILTDFVKQATVRAKYPVESKTVAGLNLADVAYQLSDTLKKIRIENAAFAKDAQEFWNEKFFSNEYCAMDHVIPGASEYVRRLYGAGAEIVYLSGRDKPRMEDCTVKALKVTGFPLGKRARLMLKPDKDVPDLKFKEAAFTHVARFGKVVAGFENEPANINAIGAAFPTAALVFLDTAHSNKPVEPNPKCAWVKDFVIGAPPDETL